MQIHIVDALMQSIENKAKSTKGYLYVRPLTIKKHLLSYQNSTLYLQILWRHFITKAILIRVQECKAFSQRTNSDLINQMFGFNSEKNFDQSKIRILVLLSEIKL